MTSGKWFHRGRAFVIDVSPLRQSRDYRWLYFGSAFGRLGRQITVVAIPFQAYELTGSTLVVGLLGAVQLVPLVVMALVGGALADAVDRKRLLFWTQILLGATAAGLMANAAVEAPALWPLFVLSALNAALSAVDGPTRAAVIPNLVAAELLPSAFALNQMLLNVAKVVGPALAGALIASVGLAPVYLLEVICFVVASACIVPMKPLLPDGGGTKVGFASIVEGFSFLRSQPLIKGTLLVDLNAMVFGLPQALFPAVGTDVLGGDAAVVGMLYSATGVGALLGALTSGWVSAVRRQGLAVIVAVMIWGACIIGFGLSDRVVTAVMFLAIAGAADVVSAVFRTTILQLAVPDALRGRVSGVNNAAVSGGPRLGDVEAGVVAALTSVQFSIISGGLVCMLGTALIGWRTPDLVRYQTKRTPPGDAEP